MYPIWVQQAFYQNILLQELLGVSAFSNLTIRPKSVGCKISLLKAQRNFNILMTLLHSEWPNLHRVLDILSAKELKAGLLDPLAEDKFSLWGSMWGELSYLTTDMIYCETLYIRGIKIW